MGRVSPERTIAPASDLGHHEEVSMQIRKYRLEPSAFASTTKRRLGRHLAWQIPLTVGLTFVFILLSSRAQRLEVAWWWFPVALLAVPCLILAPIPRAMKRARKAWDEFELTVSDNVLHLRLGGVPPVEVLRPEVKRVVERKGFGLLVSSPEPGRQIFIPEHLRGFEEVREHLRSWRELEPPSLALDRFLGILWTVILLGSWVASAAIPDIRFALAAGVVLLATVALLMRRVLQQKAVDNRFKAKHLMVFGMFAFVPAYRLAFYLLFPS